MENIIETIRRELEQQADPKIQASSLRFFKEPIKCYGLKSATVKSIGKEQLKKLKDLSKEEIFELCRELWQSGYIEESFIACQWSYAKRKAYTPEDFEIIEAWIEEYVTNWASCDTLCNHTMGEFMVMHPQYLERLKTMAQSPNRWMRRASAVSLIVPAKRGKFLHEILQIADILLLDRDDMVQKGYGWMLKAASQAHPQQVFDYVMQNKALMPRTALRYAIEKLHKEMRSQAMQK